VQLDRGLLAGSLCESPERMRGSQASGQAHSGAKPAAEAPSQLGDRMSRAIKIINDFKARLRLKPELLSSVIAVLHNVIANQITAREARGEMQTLLQVIPAALGPDESSKIRNHADCQRPLGTSPESHGGKPPGGDAGSAGGGAGGACRESSKKHAARVTAASPPAAAPAPPAAAPGGLPRILQQTAA